MKYEHVNEIKGIVILALSLIVLAALVSFSPNDLSWYTSRPGLHAQNWIGIAGAYSAGILFFVLGSSAYFLVVIGFFWSWNKFTSREIYFSFPKFLSLIILFIVIGSLMALGFAAHPAQRFSRAGVVGVVFSDFLLRYFSPLGAVIILLMFGALSLVVIGEFMVSPFFVWLFRSALNTVKGVFIKSSSPENHPKISKGLSFPNAPQTFGGDTTLKPAQPLPPPKIRIVEPKETPKPVPPIGGILEQKPKTAGEYHLPGLDLLNDPPQVAQSAIQSALMGGAKTLEETLADFGVNVKVVDIERGPVITRYELQPAPGVKIQRISSLSDDIALALSVPAVRILAPIPGKNRVGVEVPNGLSASVYLKDVLAQSVLRSSDSKLMLAVGKDTSGKPLIADLCDMPHLLVAGTTGSGKTVCLNSLIMSILFNASPSEVKFIMVDPKMVELAPYNDLPHLICPVVTDVKKVTAALNWVVGEMEQRYKLLAKEQVRNIKGYQAKGHEMPYIVIVVDELADLMQVSARSIEGAIARLSQLARAVGIHLILATQRPSVDVVTGIIKANFPARISFKVASKVDSRTVLDGNGAQDLLGKGDLLFMKPGEGKPTRGQCCFVSDEEISRVIAFIKKQGDPEYNESVLKPSLTSGGAGLESDDEMYDEAVRVVVETNQASVSILQRRLRLGYSRAARLIDIMEQKGIVGAYAGSKARDILVDREKWLLDNMGNIPSDAGTNAAENT